VVPILASVGWVGYLVWPHLSVEPIARDTDYNPSQVEFVRYLDDEKGKIETQDEFFLPATTSGMPQWVTEGIKNYGDVVQVPVHGDWQFSEAEAENEARAQAVRTIRQDLVLTYPAAAQWRIDVKLDDLDAVAAESIESKLFDFGNDEKEPMYRTHLLVELSDNVRGQMLKHWQPQLQEYRMAMLFTFGGLLTAVCFAGATCLKFDLRTEGQYRRSLRTATVLVVIAAAAVAHGVLNSLWFPHSV
jgi:hypothetical protein